MKIKTSLLYVSISLFFLFLLSANVIKNRITENKLIGISVGTDLERASRAQGNFIEYSVIFVVALVVLDLAGSKAKTIHALGSIFFAGRISHAFSICYFEPAHNIVYFRQIGMMCTFSTMLLCSIVLFVKYFKK